MTRAFGDYSLKQHLSVQPDIWDEQLSATDEFFVIASDGVWHVMSSQEVVDLVHSTTGTPEEVSQAVVSAAVERQSKDDIACLVVYL
jgi:protein phosphatase 1L